MNLMKCNMRHTKTPVRFAFSSMDPAASPTRMFSPSRSHQLTGLMHARKYAFSLDNDKLVGLHRYLCFHLTTKPN